MGSDLVRDRIKISVGKEIKIFLFNEFIHEGKLTNVDDKYVEILDYRTHSYKIVLIDDIKEMKVRE